MASEKSPRLSIAVNERDHVRGPEDAPVTVVEYGDYECPHCGGAERAVHMIRSRTHNQVRVIYRHFPISTLHPHARLAAEAAEAAGAQGKFWEMHDLLFAHQDELEEQHLIHYAKELDLDMERFERELSEHVHRQHVRDDFKSGLASGAAGTPTWYIDDVRYDGAWDPDSVIEFIQKPMAMKIQRLTQEFTRLAASGGIMLLIFTIIALLWANSPASHSYFELWETSLAFTVGDLSLSEHLLEWVNDGLMVLFFFVVGLEIKREFLTGELASPRKAALPIAGALGGMIAPALLYAAFNLGDAATLRGWGIPMATDIAFTLVILTVMGKRVPVSLKVFFTALAITDDLGAILVLALFYTTSIAWNSLIIAAGFFVALIVLNRWRVYSPLPYALLGIGMWLAFLQSGIHPTIAGVLLALTIPTRNPPNVRRLMAQTETALNEHEHSPSRTENRDQAFVRSLKTILERMESPAQSLEHRLQPWTTYLILPIFALANAGVSLGTGASMNLLSPVSLGIIVGLVIGKPLGITLMSWLATRSGLAEMPGDISWPQFFSASCLAGIGFTMSLFIANSAFDDPALLASAKLGTLLASVLAAFVGWTLLRLSSPSYGGVTELKVAAVTE